MITTASSLTTARTGYAMPASLANTHKVAWAFAGVNLLQAAIWLIAGMQADIASRSIMGFAGEILVIVGILVNIFGVFAPVRHSALTESGDAQNRIWAMPGASWAYADNFGKEMSFKTVTALFPHYRTRVVAWRSIRIVVVAIAGAAMFVGGMMITFTAMNIGLNDATSLFI